MATRRTDPDPPESLPGAVLPRIRVVRGDAIALGPGKVRILEAVRAKGSIAQAARELGMSYKRAWDLVETMNAEFREPLVITRTGGSRGGGAELSPSGQKVLELYESMEREARRAIECDGDEIRRLLKR